MFRCLTWSFAGWRESWWFLRKAPCWRLRCQPGDTATLAGMQNHLSHALDELAAHGRIVRWRETIYEPETYIFGGPEGIKAAHALFHADSWGILNYLHTQGATTTGERRIGRREVSVLMMSVLLRSARQEWAGQGDIWHQAAQMRPLPFDAPLSRLQEMTPRIRHLMTVGASATSPLIRDSGPLAYIADSWVRQNSHHLESQDEV
ncbi:thiopeptide-type bacteriocin biosynthesis protein [Streptomyces sp. SCSIO 30461]|uniref:thiopeptide-type bacteriocin biosynthesis protein n=1 Tax=Streptomyces sp. SCSIO 30461 TaxID=3118085 RepID=UPI0030CB9804